MNVSGEQKKKLKRWKAGFRLLITAGWIVLLFVLAGWLGWREHTAVLSGTIPLNTAAPIYGLIYMLVFLMAVAVAPVLGIAGMLLVGWERLDGRR